VNGPNRMVVENDVITLPGFGGYPGQSRLVTFQVLNVDGNPAASIPIAEAITFSNYSCTTPDPCNITALCDGTGKTDAQGRFADQWGLFTGYSPAGCGQDVVDHWQWCGPATRTPPAPNPGITFGTETGTIRTSNATINGYTLPPNSMPPGFVIKP
jgi:hypothetical protein